MQKTIETKTCKHCGTSFDIIDKDLEFYDKISPTFARKKYSIPSPTLCPDCRHQRRFLRRNERKLYHRTCDLTGAKVISNFSPEGGYKVYASKRRWGDKWDAIEYGREFDFDKPFFLQFSQLLKSVPQISLIGVGNENCDFCNHGGYSKNCYLCFDYGWNEDSAYLARSYKCKNCFDVSYSAECEMSYYLLDCDGCVKCSFGSNLEKCYNCHYCYSCKNCSSCFMCSNLVNKQYHIHNKPYPKEEYEKEVQRLKEKNQKELYAELLEVVKKSIHKYAIITSCENVTGDYLMRCKNCKEVYGAKDTEDSAYVIEPMIVDHIYDNAFSGNGGTFTLETIGCESLSNSKYCFSCRSGCSNLMYCHFCHSCKDCFGCAGLRNKEYCIFNKQYSKAEYEELVPKIIEHMIKTGERGEFFPVSISPFCYNESLGHEYYPLSKDEAIKKGFRRMDTEYAVTVPEGTTLVEAAKVESLKDEEILKCAMICESSGRPFRITKSELEYYRKNGIGLPTRHPDVRYMDRMKLRNPRKLWDRKCDKCGVEMKTTYSPERKEVVYCEGCYNKEVYG